MSVETITDTYDLPEEYVCPKCLESTTIEVQEVKIEDELWHFITITRGKRYVCNACGQQIRKPN